MGRCDPEASNPHIVSPQKHEKRQNDGPAGDNCSDSPGREGLRVGFVKALPEFLCVHGHYLLVLPPRAQAYKLM